MVILIEKSSRDKNKPNFTIIMISFAKQLKKNKGNSKLGYYQNRFLQDFEQRKVEIHNSKYR